MPRFRQTASVLALAATLLTSARPATADTDNRPADEDRAIPARYLGQTIHWRRCVDPAHLPPGVPPGSERLECGSFAAPRNWNRPNDKIDVVVAVSRLRPANRKPKASVLTNPGGPGVAGRMLPLVFLRQQRSKLLDNAELVGFDPRGTGESSNIGCGGGTQLGADLDARDRGRGNLDLILDSTRLAMEYCRVKSGELGRYINTEQTVQDLDLLRALLGRDKVSWIGYSGGTWMGAYYATYFPNRVDKFVLDSNTEFTAPWQASFDWQPMGFERRFRDDFLAWVATHDPVYHLGTTAENVRQAYEQLRIKVAENPVQAPTGSVGPNQLDTVIVGSMYSKGQFPELASAITALRQITQAPADAEASLQVADASSALARFLEEFDIAPRSHGPQPVGSDAFEATFATITCNDTPWHGEGNELVSHSDELGRAYPLMGWTWLEQPCAFWDRPALTLPTPAGKGVPPVLMVQSTHDPATPIEGALRAHRAFAGSRLLTVTNEGDHGIYASGNACVDDVVEAFLVDGAAPADDLSCAGLPLPKPREDHARTAGVPVNPLLAAARLRTLTGPLPR